MIGTPSSDSGTTFVSLPWDSEHFGFPVGQVTAPDLGDFELREALRRARQGGFRLVYWATRPARVVPKDLLDDFAGMLVDRKATFLTDLPPAATPDPTTAPGAFLVTEYPEGPASDRLVSLAIDAGLYSRFKVDPHMPPGKFESLYATWIQRSTLRELANVVLVASDPKGEAVGMVTVSEAIGVGQIGLIATLNRCRGRGVGSLLMREAHRWMRGRGATRATVVTQLANGSACRLYERSGYRLDDVKNYYHFWPQAKGPVPTPTRTIAS